MSVDLIVYLQRSSMPTPARWAAAIVEAGFPAALDADFDPDDFSGFLPCQYDGADAGFEYYSGPLTAEECEEFEISPEFDYSVTLTTHASMREYVSAAVCAGVLCQISGGELCDPQSGTSVAAADVTRWVREQIQEAGPLD